MTTSATPAPGVYSPDQGEPRPPAPPDEAAIRRDERERVAALLTEYASVFDDYGTAEAMRKALVVLLTLGPAVESRK